MNIRRISSAVIVFVLVFALFFSPLDSYISQPGGAYDLAPLVEVENGDKTDKGTFSLMTVSLSKATLATYIYAQFSNKRKILPSQNVKRPGENDKEYNVRQKKLMTDSQFNAITVAFKKVGLPFEVDYRGVFVLNVHEEGAANDLLEAGDLITSVDGMPLEKSGQFVKVITKKEVGDEVKLSIQRQDDVLEKSVVMAEIPESDGRVGLGIGFQEDRELTTDPEVTMHTKEIGGPSAGLMFTLEIMNRLLVGEDLTKGYNVAGTGEMLEDGTVGRIGGADFKVIAAARDGVEIFFAPDDEIPEEVKEKNPRIVTNYEEALQTAKEIGTDMKIVPVKTIDDALAYLEALSPK